MDIAVFENCAGLSKVTIPYTVTTINYHAFNNCPNLTIYGYSNSKAESYAKENNIDFVSLGKSKTMGDVDSDGKITSADSLFILRYSVKLEKFTDEQIALADVNSDNKIDSLDALTVLRRSVGLDD